MDRLYGNGRLKENSDGQRRFAARSKMAVRFRTLLERDQRGLVFTRVLHPIEVGGEETHEVLRVREDRHQRVELVGQPEIGKVDVEEGGCEDTTLRYGRG